MGLREQEKAPGLAGMARQAVRLLGTARESLIDNAGLSSRLYRMKLSSALIIILPALFLCGWYSVSALQVHYKYVAASGNEQDLDMEIYQIHVHDLLSRDLRRLTMHGPGDDSDLSTYAMVIGSAELGVLDANLPPDEGDSAYVDATLKKGNQVKKVRVRYRGGKHWNWNTPQKSLKVRTEDGEYLDGLDTFSFLNIVEPFPVDEQIVMDMARQEGLLTPAYFPVRLLLNNAYMGVYFFSAQPDEGLLRNERRMPGSMYSGDGAPVDEATGVSTLWKQAAHWKKVAARYPDEMNDFGEMEKLIEVVGSGTQQQFADFAEAHLDLERFETFDALDVVFGGNQHDFDQNHKLYFDPYKGRFEPVAWVFKGWEHRRALNRTENPLLIRLKDLPAYVTERNRMVARLLAGPCSPENVEERAEKLLGGITRDQASDPYWTAYQILPRISKYTRQLVRPMTDRRQEAVLESRLARYRIRADFLREETGRLDVSVGLAEAMDAAQPGTAAMDVSVDGMAGLRLVALKASWDAGCVPQAIEVFADSNMSGELEITSDRVLTPRVHPDTSVDLDEALFPGTVLVSRGEVTANRGAVRAEPEPRTYRFFFLSGGCDPRGVEIEGENMVTGGKVVATTHAAAPAPAGADHASCNDGAYAMDVGHSSLHPWCLRREPQEEIHLGPGPVIVAETRVYGPGQRVVIEPGTTFLMGDGASMIFRAKVTAEGLPEGPIVFQPQGISWGGIALQGPGTEGSRLANVSVTGGTSPSWQMVSFPAMVDVHDTSDIEFLDCRFGDISGSSEIFHGAYVEDLRIVDSEFVSCAADAVDLEFCGSEIRGLRIVGAGQECLDLMGSTVMLEGSILLGCGQNAISAGQETNLEAKNTIVAGSPTGLLAMDASKARLEGVLFYDDGIGLRIEPVSERYEERSAVKAKKLHVVKCGKEADVKGGKLKGVKEIVGILGQDDLEKLRTIVLGIEDWRSLDSFLEGLGKGVSP